MFWAVLLYIPLLHTIVPYPRNALYNLEALKLPTVILKNSVGACWSQNSCVVSLDKKFCFTFSYPGVYMLTLLALTEMYGEQ